MTNIRLTVKHGCSHAQPCSGASLGTPLPPRCRGRGALFDLGAIIWPREGGGGGVGAAASSRWQMLASQSKMAARAPGRALACLSSPACHPDTEGGAHSSTWAIIWPREGGGGGVGAAASSRWQILASQSKMAARVPGRALVCRLGRL